MIRESIAFVLASLSALFMAFLNLVLHCTWHGKFHENVINKNTLANLWKSFGEQIIELLAITICSVKENDKGYHHSTFSKFMQKDDCGRRSDQLRGENWKNVNWKWSISALSIPEPMCIVATKNWKKIYYPCHRQCESNICSDWEWSDQHKRGSKIWTYLFQNPCAWW